jgi:hypothetical protein
MRIRVLAVAAVALTAIAALPALSADTLEGVWRLAEQTYARGEADLAGRVERQHLEIRSGLGGPEVRIWTGDDARRAVGWPAVLVGGDPVAIEVRDVSVDPLAGALRADYVVDPEVEGGQRVEVTEEYRYDPDGDALVGTATFRMIRADGSRGGYVLHRRYERVR